MLKKYYKLIIFPVLGAIAGFSYFYFYSCTNGCPLTSKWYVTTLYGLLVGLIIGMPGKKKEQDRPNL